MTDCRISEIEAEDKHCFKSCVITPSYLKYCKFLTSTQQAFILLDNDIMSKKGVVVIDCRRPEIESRSKHCLKGMIAMPLYLIFCKYLTNAQQAFILLGNDIMSKKGIVTIDCRTSEIEAVNKHCLKGMIAMPLYLMFCKYLTCAQQAFILLN